MKVCVRRRPRKCLRTSGSIIVSNVLLDPLTPFGRQVETRLRED